MHKHPQPDRRIPFREKHVVQLLFLLISTIDPCSVVTFSMGRVSFESTFFSGIVYFHIKFLVVPTLIRIAFAVRWEKEVTGKNEITTI